MAINWHKWRPTKCERNLPGGFKKMKKQTDSRSNSSVRKDYKIERLNIAKVKPGGQISSSEHNEPHY